VNPGGLEESCWPKYWNNFVYRKARFSPDKSKQFLKVYVWIEVCTLIVKNTARQKHNHSPPILEMAARYNMFFIIHNMCTVTFTKYFRLLLCNQCGNESLFCWTLLYFIHYYTLFIHEVDEYLVRWSTFCDTYVFWRFRFVYYTFCDAVRYVTFTFWNFYVLCSYYLCS
jgi:hypothetical protein